MITTIERISATGRVTLKAPGGNLLYSLPGDVTITKSTKTENALVFTHRTLIPNFKEGLEITYEQLTTLLIDGAPITKPVNIDLLIELLSTDFFLVINPKIESNEDRIENLESTLIKVTNFEIISGASGNISIPTGGTILFDEFEGVVDAIVSKVDTSNTPTWETPRTAGGTQIIVTSLDGAGNYILSGNPVSNIAIIYVYSVSRLNFDYNKSIGFETLDLTALEIKNLYESNINTNVFTDEEKLKLYNIEEQIYFYTLINC